MLKDHRELILAFNARGVEYLVIGAHAVGHHSEPRGTKDLGVLIRASDEDSKAVFAALAEYGAPLGHLGPDDFNDKPTSAIQIGFPPGRVDILQGIAGVTFDEAWASRVEALLDRETPTHLTRRRSA